MPAWCSEFTSEVIRYICIVIPVVLTVWRFAEFTALVEEEGLAVAAGATTGAIIMGTVFIYIPASICRRKWAEKARNWGWRPSIVVYIVCCGVTCMMLLAYVLTSNNEDPNRSIDPEVLLAIQAIVLGLTFTEWAAKVSEEDFNTDMLTAVAADLFYAYDVYEFFDVTLHEDETVVADTWVWVVFAFGILSMCKYIPHMPITCSSPSACPKKARRATIAAMLCQELPFLVIRLITIIKHGPTADDFFFPFKNLMLLIIHSIQLCKLRDE